MIVDQVMKNPALQAFEQKIHTSSVVVEQLWDTPRALLTFLAGKARQEHVLILSAKKEDPFLESLSFLSQEEIFDFLPWETLPGEEIPPSFDVSGRRLEILYRLKTEKKRRFVHCSIQSLMQKVLPSSTLLPLCCRLEKGQKTSFKELVDLLHRLGYKKCALASEKGEFSVRGGLIDVFPTASPSPYRLDFFGDVLEEIRSYDPVGQRSIERVDHLFLCPALEWELLKKQENPVSLLEYLGPNTLLVFDDLLSLEDEYVSLMALPGTCGKMLFSLEELLKKLPQHRALFFTKQKIEQLSDVSFQERKGRGFYTGKDPFQEVTFSFFHTSITASRYHHPLIEVSDFFSRFENRAACTKEEILQGVGEYHHSDLQLYFFVEGGAEEKMIRTLADQLSARLPQHTFFQKGYLPSGFVLKDPLIAFLPAAELTHRYKIRRQKWRNTYHTPAAEFHQLTTGDVVVHSQHGIGKFLGIQTMPNHLGEMTEYFQIEYADSGKLFVPLMQSHLITRYVGAGEEVPTFSVLGSKRWQKTYTQATTSVVGYAKQLLHNMAKRATCQGTAFPEDTQAMLLFEEEFPFQETEDQLSAIAAVKKDMSQQKVMDRLICGDVGYGKTEVALRAAFKAAFEGKKQVAVLVPTTVLAEQHYQTFTSRMSNFPLEIAVLSRFCSAKEVKQVLQKIKEGTVDIVVGTHRLISEDVEFHDLGLLIIDEEQRFGVRAKEKLRSVKQGVDCLTLSATPIPRTLYMSLVGMREISMINTPPQDRLPIKTMIAETDSSMMEHALLRELSRDGQVFFIHNRIESLPRMAASLQKMVPSAKIVMGHGRMDPEEIDAVFEAFKQGQADILLSTTIVENGIDIPNANTIFIDRADQFGLSDLYQLRGRVGRWNRTAYAYFLVPKERTLPEVARKRLQALVESSGYGGGVKIAMRDLEIRGAGDILGVQQSGQISAVGFHLYCKLLKKAIEACKEERPLQVVETKMDFSLEARIPEDYVEEPSLRMELYYRLGSASKPEEIQEILEEMKDRFGPVPTAVLWLGLFSRIRIYASFLEISAMKFGKMTLSIEKQVEGKGSAKITFPLPPMKNFQVFEERVKELLSSWKPVYQKEST